MTSSAIAVTIYSDDISFGFTLDKLKYSSCYYTYSVNPPNDHEIAE